MDKVYPKFEDLDKFRAGLGFAEVVCRINSDSAALTFGGGTFRDYCDRSHINRSFELMGLPTMTDLSNMVLKDNPNPPDIFYFYKSIIISKDDAKRLYHYLTTNDAVYVTSDQWKYVYDNDVVCIVNNEKEGYRNIVKETHIINKKGVSTGYHIDTETPLDEIYEMNSTSSIDIKEFDYKLFMDQDGVCYVVRIDSTRYIKPIVNISDISINKY